LLAAVEEVELLRYPLRFVVDGGGSGDDRCLDLDDDGEDGSGWLFRNCDM
jgi:hypothetical protein